MNLPICFFSLTFLQIIAALVWTKVNPNPTNGVFINVAYGNGLYVFVGESPGLSQPIIVTSQNLSMETWNVIDQPEILRLQYGLVSIAYGNLGFVSVYSQDVLVHSVDGNDWELIPTNSDCELEFSIANIAFGNNLYWVYETNFFEGFTSQICVSSDLVNWKSIQTPIGYLSGSFGEEEFYIWGNSSSVYSTLDGSTWKVAFQFPTPITAAFIKDTGMITTISNQLYYSSNLKVWTQKSTFERPVYEIVRVYGDYWAGMESASYTEVDIFFQSNDNGGSWDSASEFPITANNIAFFPPYGQNQLIYCKQSGCRSLYLGITNEFQSFFYAKNAFILVDKVGNIYESTDGKSWENVFNASESRYSLNMGLSYSELLGEFYGIENAQNQTYYIILSTDLVSWVRGSFPYAIDASVPVALTYGNGVFVICGYAFEYAGICLSSKDANNWETVIIFTASLGLPNLIFDGSTFYVGIANLTTEGTQYVLLSSEDGISWIESFQIQGENISKCFLNYASQMFVLCPNDGYYYSNRFWTHFSVPTSFSGVFYTQLLDYVFTAPYGELWISNDFSKWTKNNINHSSNFMWIVEGENNVTVAISPLDSNIYIL